MRKFITTPGSVTVHRSYDKLNVKCTDPGYTLNIVPVASATKGMAYGNLLAGGMIGAGVDMSAGAAYDYLDLITVPMEPVVTGAVSTAIPPGADTATPARKI